MKKKNLFTVLPALMLVCSVLICTGCQKDPAQTTVPREASEMFQCIKYEDKREAFGFRLHSFSTFDKIRKYNRLNCETNFSVETARNSREINLYAIVSGKFQAGVCSGKSFSRT